MAMLEISDELYEAAKKMQVQGSEWKDTIPKKLRDTLSLIEEVGREEGIAIITDAAKQAEPMVESNAKMYESYFTALVDAGRFMAESYESMQGMI